MFPQAGRSGKRARDTGIFERGKVGLRGYLCKFSVLRKRGYLEFGVASGVSSALFAALKFYVLNDIFNFIGSFCDAVEGTQIYTFCNV